jgi:hypothetical protein
MESKEISKCCKFRTYTDFTGPEIIEQLKKEGLELYKDFKPFSDVTFCASCNKPCETVFKLAEDIGVPEEN